MENDKQFEIGQSVQIKYPDGFYKPGCEPIPPDSVWVVHHAGECVSCVYGKLGGFNTSIEVLNSRLAAIPNEKAKATT